MSFVTSQKRQVEHKEALPEGMQECNVFAVW
jgi:hypothetical protein